MIPLVVTIFCEEVVDEAVLSQMVVSVLGAGVDEARQKERVLLKNEGKLVS